MAAGVRQRDAGTREESRDWWAKMSKRKAVQSSDRVGAVLYVRVSSKDQEKEGFSIPAQRKLLREYAADRGFEVVREFEDVETAKRAGRTAFNQMIRFLKKERGRCRIVLVEKTDRLVRNVPDYAVIDDLMASTGLEIHLVKENAVLSQTSRSSEKFVFGIKALMAKQYVDNLSEETRKGMREKAEQGIWPSFAPLGYRNSGGSNGKRVIEPNPETAPTVEWIFEQYATGDYSLKEITKAAKDRGLTFRKSRQPVPRTTIHRMLRNPIYAGEFVWGGRRYVGGHEPLISRELWECVQDVLDGRNRHKTKKMKHEFTYSGLITCGHCGCLLGGQRQKGRYVYYHCSGAKGKCPEPYVREEVLDEQFAEHLRKLRLAEEQRKWLLWALGQTHREEQAAHQEAVNRLRQQEDSLERRIHTLYEDRLDGRISAEEYDRRAADARVEQGRIRRAIERQQNADRGFLEMGIQLIELAHGSEEAFWKKSPMGRRQLLKSVVLNCSWKEGKLDLAFREPIDAMRLMNESDREMVAAGAGLEERRSVWRPELPAQGTFVRDEIRIRQTRRGAKTVIEVIAA